MLFASLSGVLFNPFLRHFSQLYILLEAPEQMCKNVGNFYLQSSQLFSFSHTAPGTAPAERIKPIDQ